MFHEMRYVYEVYRQLSFSKAAQALYISQPSLSLMIKKAEKRVGSALFDRGTTPISLTGAGQAYIRSVQQIMEIEDGFRNYLSDVDGCLTGSLSLGGTTLFTSYVLPPLISKFSACFPKVEIKLHEMHTSLLQEELHEGTLDLVVENCEFDPALYVGQVYLQEQIMLAVPAGLAINRRLTDFCLTNAQLAQGEAERTPPVPLHVFEQEDFLLLKEGNDTRKRADKLCSQAGFCPRIRLLMEQQIAAYHLAAYGLGVTFVSDTLIKRAPPDTRLLFYRLDSSLSQRSIRFFYKRNRFVTRPMREFLQMLDEE